MSRIIRILAVDEENSLDFPGLLRANPGVDLIFHTTTFAEAAQKLTILVPDLILYHPSSAKDEFKHIQDLGTLGSQAAIVVLASQTDPDYVRQCLRAGAYDYILLPIDGVVLRSEIDKVYARKERRQKTETLSVLMDRFTGGPKLLSFFSGKGGVGKSTLAVNTAVALAKFGKRVVLVDLNLDMVGDDVLLNLSPKHSIADLAAVPMDTLREVVAEYLEAHDSGIQVLASPRDSAEIEALTPTLVRVVLQTLQRQYEYVLVDLAPAINSVLLTVLEISSECYMVSTPNLAVLRANRNLLELLGNLDYDMHRVGHILNCVGVKNGVKLSDVERLLKAPIGITMEYNFDFVEQALNKGTPFVLWKERHSLSRSVFEFTRRIIGISRKPKRDRKKS